MYDCIYFYTDTGTSTVPLLASSTCSVATSSVPAISTTTDIALFPYMTAGEIFISLLLVILVLHTLFTSVLRALDHVKIKRRFLHYGGGDVEVSDRT